jgi:transcriptional regulator with GAF, ATPase, and Fis domain
MSDERGRARVEAELDPSRPLDAARAPARFDAIYEVGRRLLGQRQPAEVLEAIQRALADHLHPDRACVLLADADGWRPVLTHEMDLSGPPDRWPLSMSVLRHVRDSGQAVLASDTSLDTQFGAAESIHRFRIRSVLCVPLGRPVRGVLYADNRSERPFTVDDLQFVAAIGAYAGLLLERAEEFAEARSALAESGDRLAIAHAELLRHEIVGSSPPLLAAWDMVRRLARGGARVLLRGESGTGKELFARAYAVESGRTAAYVPVPVPALAPGVVESELFGHVKGAFTEAARDKKGRLEVAHRGVLFLDEIGDVEPALQVKLLRFLDSGELYRVGDTQPRRVDALVVSATNRDLEKDVEQGRFRGDLLARLGHVVRVPPLRERPGDVRVLAEHFLGLLDRTGRKRFAPDAMAALERHSWPLNVRELRLVVERAVFLVDRDEVAEADLPAEVRRSAGAPGTPGAEGPPGPMRGVVEAAERAHILRALEHTKGNRRRAIELLRMAPETFYRRLEEYGIPRKGG